MSLIAVAENDLRYLVESVMTSHLGSGWFASSGLTPERVQLANDGRAAEAKMKPHGETGSLIRFTQLWDLTTIILKNWDRFAQVFGDKKTFSVYMKKLGEFRNSPAHSRELLPFEESLVAGISGEIRNRITIYRSSMAPDKSYYPSIESVRDSFGAEWLASRDGTFGVGFSAPTTLVVGQVVEFECRAWDPQARPIHWSLEWQTVGRPCFDSAVGNNVRLRMTTEETHVGEGLNVAIVMKAESKYHRRQSGWDDSAAFLYDVIPPTLG
jgi:hypothetical protein